MSNVKLKIQKHDGPLLLRRGGVVYELSHHTDCNIPVNIAVGMLGDDGLIVEFVKEDKEAIADLVSADLKLLNREFSLSGSAQDAAEHLFPTKKKVAKKSKPKPTKLEELVAAAKEETSAKEPVEEEVAEEDSTQD
tara:strand:- start:1082 stop:1489 length:408 start_codon:yes stop_codon:yes gene_type:complete